MVIEVKRLGLAAYIKMNGAKLIRVENNLFVFESEKDAKDWGLEYSNSCCSQHDSILCELRKLIN